DPWMVVGADGRGTLSCRIFHCLACFRAGSERSGCSRPAFREEKSLGSGAESYVISNAFLFRRAISWRTSKARCDWGCQDCRSPHRQEWHSSASRLPALSRTIRLFLAGKMMNPAGELTLLRDFIWK